MLVLVEREITFALGFTGAEEAVGRGELGHQQATTGNFFVLENSWRVLPGAVGHLLLQQFRGTVGRGHDVMRTTHKTGIANEAAEDRIRDARHGSENRGRRDANAADLESLRHARAFRGEGGVGRIFPEFLHEQNSKHTGHEGTRSNRAEKHRSYEGLKGKASAAAEASKKLWAVISWPLRVSLPQPYWHRIWRTCGGSARRVRRCPPAFACR